MTLASSPPQSYPTAEAKEDRRSGSLPQEVKSRVSVDHKLTRTGFEKDRAAPPLLGQLS